MGLGTPVSTPGRSWPHPWGTLTTPGWTALVTSTGTRWSPSSDRTLGDDAVGETDGAASSGWTSGGEWDLPFTSTPMLCIHLLLERTWRRPMRTNPPVAAPRSRSTPEAGDVGEEGSGASSTMPGGAQHLGQAGLEGTEVDAVRVGEEVVEREKKKKFAEALALRPGTQQVVDHPLGAGARSE